MKILPRIHGVEHLIDWNMIWYPFIMGPMAYIDAWFVTICYYRYFA